MKAERVPHQIRITFEYEELKILKDSIDTVVMDNRYMTRNKVGTIITSLDHIADFLREIDKVL
jgi:hypothetical protein